jgi:hypothetical protein
MASKKTILAKSPTPFEVREVSDDKRKGRGVFSTRDFKFGDVIMTEKDAVLAQENYADPPLPFLVCEHCLAYVGSLELQLEIMASDLEVEPIPQVRHSRSIFPSTSGIDDMSSRNGLSHLNPWIQSCQRISLAMTAALLSARSVVSTRLRRCIIGDCARNS